MIAEYQRFNRRKSVYEVDSFECLRQNQTGIDAEPIEDMSSVLNSIRDDSIWLVVHRPSSMDAQGWAYDRHQVYRRRLWIRVI